MLKTIQNTLATSKTIHNSLATGQIQLEHLSDWPTMLKTFRTP